MGCGNSVENVKEMRPLEVPTKAMEPADISEGRNDKNLGNNIMTEMKTNDVSKSNEINTEETSQPVVSSSSVAIPLEKEKEKQKNDKKEKAAAGEIIQNNISAAFHQKKLSKAQIEKENEEKRLMEMFRSLPPKTRFQTATKLHRKDVQQSSAIEWIQIEWRAKLARKRAHERRLERERRRREKAALTLQCATRVFQARKVLLELKAERERLRREGAAIYIQCAWRVKSAREKLFQLRVEYGAAIFLQCRWRIFLSRRELRKRRIQRAASIQIQRRFRGVLGRKRFLQLMKEFHPHTLMVLLKTVTLTHGGAGAKASANVSMIATSYTLQSRSQSDNNTITQQKTGSKKAKRSDVVSGPQGSNEYVLRSWTQSKQINDSSSPVWNEELTVTNSTWNSQIVLTLIDHGRFGKQSVIGQSIIEVSNYPTLYDKTGKADLISVPMELYSIPIKDSTGKEIVPSGSPPSPIHALLWCSIRLPPLSRSMCGWVWRIPGRIIGGSGQFKRRWMILVDRMLLYYEDPYTLHTFKGALVLEDVVSVVNEKRKDGPAIRLNCRQGSGQYVEHWIIRWDESEPLYIQQMWERKLRRCLPLHATYTNQTVE